MNKEMEKSSENGMFLNGRGYTASELYKTIALLVGNGVYSNELTPTALLNFPAALQTIHAAHPQINDSNIVHHFSLFVKRKVKQERKEIENRFWKKSRQPQTDVKKPPEFNSGGG